MGKFIVDKYRAKNSVNIDDWTAKREDQIVLINLIEEFNLKSFFEIGTYTAFTTQLLASHPNIERWKGIDTNPKDAHENISKCDSENYKPTEEFDLVFIDGDHKQAKRDTELALKMNPKIIAWHDYVDTGDFPNLVKKDVDLYKPINVEANIAWKKIRD